MSAAAIAAFVFMFGTVCRRLSREMLVEEAGDLAERLLGLGRKGIEIVLRVRHALEHLQLGSTPARRSLRWVSTVRLRNRSRVPLVRMAGGKPVKSP